MTPRRWSLAGGLSVALLAVVAWAVAGAPLPGRPTTSDSAAASEGRALYATHCASCHGARGEGAPDWKTKRADGTYPAPPHDASGHTWHHADGLLFRIVRDGGGVAAPPDFKSGMPGFAGTLTDAQVRATLAYIRTFWGPAEREFQADVSARDPYP